MKVTKEDITTANQAGLRHKNNNIYWSYHTPILQVAYDNGKKGIKLDTAVSGTRYGNAPKSGLSYNYRDNCSEKGLSLISIDDGDKTQDKISLLFLSNRPIKKYVGFKLEKTGGDGEPLILPFDTVDNLDCF